MTFWDFLCEFIEKGGLAWTLLVIALGGVFWLIAHPQVVKEWNVQITMWIAAIAPKKRKSAFEKRLNLTKSFPDRRTIENSDLCANSPKKL